MMREGGATTTAVVAAAMEVVAQIDTGRNCAVASSDTRCYEPRG
jgi:hypothetical protein